MDGTSELVKGQISDQNHYPSAMRAADRGILTAEFCSCGG